jgi:DNA-binding beta-propeller fold protein YncE
MPLASPPGRPDVVYRFGRIDASGRVADRVTIAALGWRGGDRLTVTAEAGVMIARDRRIADPRGLSLDPSGALVYLNSGQDRVLAIDLRGYVVRDSGRIPGLDPGGAEFGPDGRYYLTVRRQRTIRAMPAALDSDGEFLLPAGIVPFPRGFGFGPDGQVYLASGAAPSGQGDNTIAVSDRSGTLLTPRLVTDPELSPLDLKFAPNGNIVVASEWPFGAADSVREYDPVTGQLARVLVPDRSVGFRRPRGLRFGPGGRLYCPGGDHVVAFDFSTGSFAGPVVHLARLNGQAMVLVP